MDFLKQNNFRYIVIIIIIIISVINLCKINSQENFMVLNEDQNLGSHKVTMNDTDQVMFGNETLTHKLKNVDTLTVNNDLTVKRNAFFVFDNKNSISIYNENKTLDNQANRWSIYNFNNYNGMNGLSFWRYNQKGCVSLADGGMCNEHMTMNDDGTTVFKGGLTVDGELTVRGDTRPYGHIKMVPGKHMHNDTFLVMRADNGDLLLSSVSGSVKVTKEFGGTGDLTVEGIFTNSSDRRLKENIKNISQNDKDKVLQLVPKTYNMISDQNKKRYGLIAQEVEELYPELVNTNETDGMKSLNYIELIPLLLEQIKELKKSVEQIKTLINM